MPDQNLSADFIEQLNAITKKRPRAVIDHILEHGFVTTEELTTLYGYQHAPRAARDLREGGVPLETFRGRVPVADLSALIVSAISLRSDRTEDETSIYDQIKAQSVAAQAAMPDFVKDILRKHLER